MLNLYVFVRVTRTWLSFSLIDHTCAIYHNPIVLTVGRIEFKKMEMASY